MADKSKDMKAEDAIARLKDIKNPDYIRAFIEDEERKTVLNAAEDVIKKLSVKDGDTGSISKVDEGPRGEGVEGTKSYVTGEDVLKNLRAKGVKI